MEMLTELTRQLFAILGLPLKANDAKAFLMVFVLLSVFIGLSSILSALKETQERRRRVGLRSETPRSAAFSVCLKLFRKLGLWARPQREDEISKFRHMLLQAGYRRADALLTFFGIKFGLTLLLPVLLISLRPPAMRMLSYPNTALIVILLAMLGFYLPSIWLRIRTQSRRQKIAAGFPDALDLMVVCVEAGLGLDAAIHEVGKEIALRHPVLNEEFNLVDSGLRRGQSREMALRNLSLRTNLDDVSSFVTLIIQALRFGSSIAQALRVQAEAMRIKRQQRAEKIAAQLPVKLLFPLIFFIFPFFFVVVLGPPVIQLLKALSSVVAR